MKLKLDHNHWQNWANRISAPSKPEEYDHNAVKRLTQVLEKNIVRVSGVQFQFKPRNRCVLIDFTTDWEHEFYKSAEARFLKDKEELEGKILDGSESPFMRFAIMNKYREAAEFCKTDSMAKRTAERLDSGKASFIAVNNRATIARYVKVLDEKYGIKRDNISLIWGGSDTYSGTQEKFTKADMMALLKEISLGKEVDKGKVDKIRKQLIAKRIGLDDIDPEYKLGPQSKSQANEERLNFQRGKTLVMAFTLRKGGTGLDLHHTDDYTIEKVRRRESGWAELEDIVNIPTRPRGGDITPTYNPVEFVQALGRTVRITSLSSSDQDILFYRGTIEEEVCFITGMKLRCLREVVKGRESWEDAIYYPEKYREEKNRILSDDILNDDDLSEIFNEVEDEEEENGDE